MPAYYIVLFLFLLCSCSCSSYSIIGNSDKYAQILVQIYWYIMVMIWTAFRNIILGFTMQM